MHQCTQGQWRAITLVATLEGRTCLRAGPSGPVSASRLGGLKNRLRKGEL